ncbi:hypothetical protein RUND412_011059 [Rhizina undulata]
MPHLNKATPATAALRRSARLPGPQSAPTTTQHMPEPSATPSESLEITRAEVPQPSAADIPIFTQYEERHASGSSHTSSEPGFKKPRVDFEGSSSDLRTPSPLSSPLKSAPPPAPLKSILKRCLETSPGSPYAHENPERAYIVGIYDRLFSQRDVNGRILGADYKRDVRGGAKEDEFSAHALAVGNEDEDEDSEDFSGGEEEEQ